MGYRYRALTNCFFNGQSYGPREKRKFVETNEPLKPVPKYLEPVNTKTVELTPAEKKAEKKAKAAAEKALKEQQEKDALLKKTEEAAVNFVNAPATPPKIETL